MGADGASGRAGGRGLRSMTGFGAGRHGPPGQGVEVEVRAVNNRHLKVSCRVPEVLSGLAPRLEDLARARLARGSLALAVRLEGRAAGATATLDAALLRALHGQLAALARELGAPAPGVAEVAALPGVVREDPGPDAEALWPEVEAAARAALEALDAMRRVEGDGLARELRGLVGEVRTIAGRVEAVAPAVVREQGARLRARVERLVADAGAALAPGDLAREVALLADRADVAEELQRLRSHCEQVEAALALDEPVGRRLEFLAQELHREANTLASKTHDAGLGAEIVELRLRVERIREQVANVE